MKKISEYLKDLIKFKDDINTTLELNGLNECTRIEDIPDEIKHIYKLNLQMENESLITLIQGTPGDIHLPRNFNFWSDLTQITLRNGENLYIYPHNSGDTGLRNVGNFGNLYINCRNLLLKAFTWAEAEDKRGNIYFEDEWALCTANMNEYITTAYHGSFVLFGKVLNIYVGGIIPETLVVPEGIEVLNIFGLSYMKSLRSVYLPKSLKRIKPSVFSGCTNLTDVYFKSETPPNFVMIHYYNDVHHYLATQIPGNVNLHVKSEYRGNYVEIDPNTGEEIFKNTTWRTKANTSTDTYTYYSDPMTPDNLLGDYVWEEDGDRDNYETIDEKLDLISTTKSEIKTVLEDKGLIMSDNINTWNQQVLELRNVDPGYYSENYYKFLMDIDGFYIPQGVTTIAAYSLGQTRRQTSLSIPASVETISVRAFMIYGESGLSFYQRNLISLSVSQDNPNYSSGNGTNSIMSKDCTILYHGCSGTTDPTNPNRQNYDIVIPDGVDTLKGTPFYGIPVNNKKIYFPESLIRVTTDSSSIYPVIQNNGIFYFKNQNHLMLFKPSESSSNIITGHLDNAYFRKHYIRYWGTGRTYGEGEYEDTVDLRGTGITTLGSQTMIAGIYLENLYLGDVTSVNTCSLTESSITNLYIDTPFNTNAQVANIGRSREGSFNQWFKDFDTYLKTGNYNGQLGGRKYINGNVYIGTSGTIKCINLSSSSVSYTGKDGVVHTVGPYTFSYLLDNVYTTVSVGSLNTISLAFAIFMYYTGLEHIDLGNFSGTLPTCCFSNCTSLLSIDLSNCTRLYNSNYFYSCTSLESIILPTTVYTDSATSSSRTLRAGLANCKNLKKVIVPECFNIIGRSSFTTVINSTDAFVGPGHTQIILEHSSRLPTIQAGNDSSGPTGSFGQRGCTYPIFIQDNIYDILVAASPTLEAAVSEVNYIGLWFQRTSVGGDKYVDLKYHKRIRRYSEYLSGTWDPIVY